MERHTGHARRRHWWLLVLPFIWQVAMVPVVNDIGWRPLQLPFPLLWQMLGVVFTTGIIGLVYMLDRRLERALEAESAHDTL